MSVCLSACLSACLFACLSVHLSRSRDVCVCACVCVFTCAWCIFAYVRNSYQQDLDAQREALFKEAAANLVASEKAWEERVAKLGIDKGRNATARSVCPRPRVYVMQ